MNSFSFFFFTATATTAIYTLSLHDALPILQKHDKALVGFPQEDRTNVHGSSIYGASAVLKNQQHSWQRSSKQPRDRKSTRLNSSHTVISYAVFCLKKKKKNQRIMKERDNKR